MQTNGRKPHALIVIPAGLPLDWPADYEMRTAHELSKTNIVIVFAVADGVSLRQLLTGTRPFVMKRTRNFHIFRPFYILPFQRFTAVRKINTRFCVWQLRCYISMHRSWRTLRRIFWTFSLQYEVFPHHFPEIYFPVYDCVDAFTSENPLLKRQWERYEDTHVREARVVFTNQHTLYERMRLRHPDVYRAPIGFYDDLFRSHRQRKQPKDLKLIPRPRVCFVGNINSRIDFGFMNKLARMSGSCAFVFIGALDDKFTGRPGTDFPTEIRSLKKLPNVYFLGPRQKSQIPAYIRFCDAGIIPYDTAQTFNRNAFPMKTLEYFSMGKPVISTPLPELTKLDPLVTCVRTPAQAHLAIAGLISRPWPDALKKRQRRFAAENSWRKKIMRIRTVLRHRFSITI